MLEGIDVSHWQGSIDWSIVRLHTRFAILKCTEGNYYADDTYLTNKQGCIDNGIPHGAYHYFRSNISGIEQAKYFYDRVGPDMEMLVCDVESNDGGDLRVNLRLFMQTLEDLSGYRPWVYTGPAFWRAYGIHDDQWCAYHPLWIANYGVQQPSIPPAFTSWKIWQYSDKGVVPGIPGNSVDMNVFNGTEEQLAKVFGNGIVIPPAHPVVVRVTADVLNVRTAPMGRILGQVKKGWLLGVDGVSTYNGVKWYKIGTGYVSSQWCEDATG